MRVPGSFNFGLFAASAPTDGSCTARVRLIETMRNFSWQCVVHQRSNTTTEACPIDQILFQRLVRLATGGVKEKALKVAILPRKAYVNFMAPPGSTCEDVRLGDIKARGYANDQPVAGILPGLPQKCYMLINLMATNTRVWMQ